MIKKTLLTSLAVVTVSLLLAPGASAAGGLTTTAVQHIETRAVDTCPGDSGGPLVDSSGSGDFVGGDTYSDCQGGGLPFHPGIY
ncbi:trypsin-like serine protease [Streptomyces sp. NPDC003042]